MLNCDVINVLLFPGEHIPEEVCFSSEIPAQFLDTTQKQNKKKERPDCARVCVCISLSLSLILIKGREIDPLHYTVSLSPQT